jgi:hypothetical protein
MAVAHERREAGFNREENDMSASILCGVDGSAESRAALSVAGRMADRLPGEGRAAAEGDPGTGDPHAVR